MTQPPPDGARRPALHLERDRAEGFGSDAERYDRARPSYPDALVDDLLATAPRRVLDVGCGTGKAARLFAARGVEVVGVEVDARMAAVAARVGVSVELGAFETWDRAGRRFDLVTCGQAWHWVDPVVGPARAAEALDEGGFLALFWNYRRSLSAALDATMRDVYARRAPELVGGPLLGAFDPDAETARHAAAIAGSGAFGEVERLEYRWQERYTKASWLDLVATQSDHRLLGAGRLEALLGDVGAAIERIGGSFVVDYETVCLRAPRAT